MNHSTSGPFHVTVHADVWVSDPDHVPGGVEQRLPELVAGMIREHAWQSGLEIIDPESVRVAVDLASE